MLFRIAAVTMEIRLAKRDANKRYQLEWSLEDEEEDANRRAKAPAGG
jgi:hypothetical protein